jgi:hypothetical protein
MIWAIFALLLIMMLVAIFASYTMLGGILLIILISVVLALGIHSIRRIRVE